MKQAVIRKSKWFWPWQDDQEETWLEEMSRQGYHLIKAHPMAQYDFIQGEPQDCIYRLDFQSGLKKKNKEVYLCLFTDAGWEYLGEMNGWQYFRKLSHVGDETEIFTDPDSKVAKYNRYLTYLGAIFPSYLVIFVALWSSWPEWMMWLNIAIILVFSAISLVFTVKITRRIKQLRAI